MLQEQDRVGVADGGDQQSFGVVRVGRTHDFDSGLLDELRFDRVWMELGSSDSATKWRADRDRTAEPASAAISISTQLRPDLVHGLMRESEKLDLRNRDHPPDRQADRRPDDGALGEGHVHDPFRTEAFKQTLGDAKDAAKPSDVHAEHHHSLVPLHLGTQCRAKSLDHVQLGHDTPAPEPQAMVQPKI